MMEHVHDSWWFQVSECWRELAHPAHFPQSVRIFLHPAGAVQKANSRSARLADEAGSCEHCESLWAGKTGRLRHWAGIEIVSSILWWFSKDWARFCYVGGSSVAMFFTFCFSMGWIRRDSAWQQPFLVVPGSLPQGLSVWITLRPFSGLCAFRWVGTPNQKRQERPSFDGAFEALGSTKTRVYVMYVSLIIYIYRDISYFYIVLYYTTGNSRYT